MKRHLFSAVASAVLLAAFPTYAIVDLPAQAFDVKVALTSVCTIETAGTELNFGTYTAFDAAPSVPAPTVSWTLKCTRGLGAPSTVIAGGEDGVVAGLNYSLVAATNKTTVGTPATAGSAGSHDVYTVTITGSMGANQAGDATASATDARTVTISY